MLSDNAFSALVPVLDQVLGLRPAQIRKIFESKGLVLRDWERARTDRVTIDEVAAT